MINEDQKEFEKQATTGAKPHLRDLTSFNGAARLTDKNDMVMRMPMAVICRSPDLTPS